MNFHISPLSPLRPRYSTSLGPNPPGRPEQQQQPYHNGSTDHHHHHHHHRHHHAHTTPTPPPTTTTVGPGPLSHPKIEVEGAEADDEMAAGTTSTSSSSSSSDSGSDISADDVTQDSRDVLVQRLNDLAQRLSAADVRASDVGALHAQVDDMERVLSRGSRARSASRHSSSGVRRRGSSSLQPGPGAGTGAGLGSRRRSMVLPGGDGGGGGGGNGDAYARGDALGLMGPPLSPSWLMSQFQRRPSVPRVDERGLGYRDGGDDVDQTSELHKARPVLLLPTHLHPSSVEQPEPVAAAADATSGNDSPKISSEMADRIVEEAEGLCAEMASVIESLQKRREESDHLHAVLIQREGAADKLILEQAGRIGELEDTVAEDESELRYLKIQLRGIEAQCMGYIPKGADPELDLSIRNWKKDWTSLRDRWATRRATSFASGDESSTFSNSASPSAG